MRLISIAHESNVKVQVGHVERFNPAMVAAYQYIDNPMFIEVHRLASFNPRGSDVPVVLDLMIHDLDIVLHIVQSKIKRLSASGVAVVTDSADIVNARLEFENGCVANITTSRISTVPMRKARFFQKDAYIAVDFLNKKAEMARMLSVDKGNIVPHLPVLQPPNGENAKQIIFEELEVKQTNAIQTELASFARSIINNSTPDVTILDGYEALKVAYQILDKVKGTQLAQ